MQRPKPSSAHELDSKENCRWVTRRQNLSNRRNNRLITYRSRTLTITEWARESGFNERTLSNRINRGWPLDRAFTEPVALL